MKHSTGNNSYKTFFGWLSLITQLSCPYLLYNTFISLKMYYILCWPQGIHKWAHHRIFDLSEFKAVSVCVYVSVCFGRVIIGSCYFCSQRGNLNKTQEWKEYILIRTWYESINIHEKFISRKINITLDDSPEPKNFVFPPIFGNLLISREYLQILYSMHVCVASERVGVWVCVCSGGGWFTHSGLKNEEGIRKICLKISKLLEASPIWAHIIAVVPCMLRALRLTLHLLRIPYPPTSLLIYCLFSLLASLVWCSKQFLLDLLILIFCLAMFAPHSTHWKCPSRLSLVHRLSP